MCQAHGPSQAALPEAGRLSNAPNSAASEAQQAHLRLYTGIPECPPAAFLKPAAHQPDQDEAACAPPGNGKAKGKRQKGL
eukprot:1147834-Pelagomonas_calceolata.AAC.1